MYILQSLISKVQTWLEFFEDLRPLRIAGEGDEESWFAMLSHDRHCILVVLRHVSVAASERPCRRRKQSLSQCILNIYILDKVLRWKKTIM